MAPDHHNRWVEAEVDRLEGRKSLYSAVFYRQDRFWDSADGPVYRRLKERYDPSGRLLIYMLNAWGVAERCLLGRTSLRFSPMSSRRGMPSPLTPTTAAPQARPT